MSFTLEGHYVWDFWTAYDEPTGLHHLFFLKAPDSLGDPELRHHNASVGHATSEDLVGWTVCSDALAPQHPPAFDDLATWTGCCLRGDDGRWRMFTTGLNQVERERVQRVGVATSEDLTQWQRSPEPLVLADPRWYATRSAGAEEHWRDPWVLRAADGTWHMYLTAQDAATVAGRGVIGHAVSADLANWRVQPPLSRPTGIFEWLEVIQVVQVEGRWVLLFSCLADQMPGADPGSGGVWSVPVAGPGAPVDVGAAVRVTDESLYVGKVVHHRGAAHFLAFRNRGEDGAFLGGLTDPVRVGWRADGLGLSLEGG